MSGPLPAGNEQSWTFLFWLSGSAAVLLAASVLVVGEHRQVLIPGLDLAIPETCAMHTTLGIDCPGCGLTRCFIHTAHGDLGLAWQLSPVGMLLWGYVVLQIPLALAHLWHRRSPWLAHATDINQRTLIGLLVALLIQWTIRFVTGDLS
ncbi:MAG: DUF2752 domain-containing protein [Planctomycetales bacterium]|nr:DUF2752 domain-containing protein [Planctomycetales bacterium]